MPKVMLTFDAAPAPTLEEIKRRFGLSDGDIDEAFGVIEIDPQTHTHTILVEQSVAERITSSGAWNARGPSSNPRIAPFGPPEK